VPPPYPDSPVIRNDIADYYFEVQRFDRDVGAALALLEARGELENTIIVMTGDHGWPFPRGKTHLYDLGSRVPLVMRWPGHVAAGSRPKGLVTLVDLAPTFLSAASIAPPEVMTGEDLLPRVRGEVAPRRSVVLGRERHTVAQENHEGGYPMRALRTEAYLYIVNFNPDDWPSGWEAPGPRPFRDCDNGPTKSFLLEHRLTYARAFALCFGKRPGDELYDVAADPWQLTNLVDDPASQGVRRLLASELHARCRQLGDPRSAGRADELVGAYRGGR
jgi:arylsulfatase A-like enzyme